MNCVKRKLERVQASSASEVQKAEQLDLGNRRCPQRVAQTRTGYSTADAKRDASYGWKDLEDGGPSRIRTGDPTISTPNLSVVCSLASADDSARLSYGPMFSFVFPILL